jgi:hypothetical protein
MMSGYYENTGGLSALPRRTVLGGEEHLLSYITHEEAEMLREEGGGVTPTGGQYRGPGGVPAFIAGPAGLGPDPFGGVASSVPSGYSPYGGVHGNVPGTESFGKGRFGKDTATPASIMSLFSKKDRDDINPASFQAMLDNPVATMSKGLFGDTHSQVRSALDMGLTDVSIHGIPGSTFGHVTGLTPAQAANPIGIPEYSRTIAGDPNSVFGLGVQGLAKGLFGLIAPPAITQPYGLASLFGDVTGLFDIPSIGDLALVSMVGDIAGEVVGDIDFSIGDALGDVFGEDAAQDLSDVYGFFTSDIPKAIESVAEEAYSDSVAQAVHDSLFSGEDAPFSSTGPLASAVEAVDQEVFTGDAIFGDEGPVAEVLGDIGNIPGDVGESLGEGLSSVADALGLSDALGLAGEAAGTLGDAVSGTLSSTFSGIPSTATVGSQGGGPDIPQLQEYVSLLTPAQANAPTFKTYPPKPIKSQEQQEPFTLEDLRNMYIGYYSEGGGLRSLPTRPIIGGQQHELSYITPEESRLLRQHGGGVTPNGGQLKVEGLNTYLSYKQWPDRVDPPLSPLIPLPGPFRPPITPEERQRQGEELERKRLAQLPDQTIGRDPFTTEPGFFESIADTGIPSFLPYPAPVIDPIKPPIQEDPVVPVQDQPVVSDTTGRDPFTTQPLPNQENEPRNFSLADLAQYSDRLPYISHTGIQNLTSPTASNTVVPMGAQQLDTPVNPVQGQTNPVAGQFMSSQYTPLNQPYTPLNQPLTNPFQNNVVGNVNLQPPSIFAYSGGGIQNLINDQKKNYSIGNQDTIDTSGTAFSRKPFSATPHEDLTNGSHSYVSNVLNGHAVPMGMTNIQQLQKPMEAFPSEGQMNYNNTLHADYSRPQSFYAMPNMNRVG